MTPSRFRPTDHRVDLGYGTALVLWGGEPHHVSLFPTTDGSGYLTTRQLQAVALVLAYGHKEAAYLMECSLSSLKRLVGSLYAKLDVANAVEAAFALGWVHWPPDLQRSVARRRRLPPTVEPPHRRVQVQPPKAMSTGRLRRRVLT